MPVFTQGKTSLYYEESGPADALPLLLIAPGGMKSAIPFWANAPWNPIEEFASDFRVIAMDQRNAGRSRAPVSASDGWRTYAGDQLALLDHLGVDRFLVAGMCIGGSYGLGLIQAAAERVAAAVLFQPIGLDDNRDAFYAMYDAWAAELQPTDLATDAAAWAQFRENMYDGDFVFSVSRDFVRGIATPLLILMGNDLYHPQSISRELTALAPNAQLIEDWKAGAAVSVGRKRVREFLLQATG